MNKHIEQLGLPRGVWQSLILEALPVVRAVQCSYPDDRSVNFILWGTGSWIAHFTLSFMYGCKAILISHNMRVNPMNRGTGIAKALQPIKERIARDLRVAILMATVRSDNLPEKAVIASWTKIAEFDNPQTSNHVEVYKKDL